MSVWSGCSGYHHNIAAMLSTVLLSWYALTLGTRLYGAEGGPLVAGVARKLGENGQYFAWNLAKGVRDKTVGKPLNRIGDRYYGERVAMTGWRGVTLSKYRDSLTPVATLLVLMGLGNWVEEPRQTGSPAVT